MKLTKKALALTLKIGGFFNLSSLKENRLTDIKTHLTISIVLKTFYSIKALIQLIAKN